MAGDAGGNRVEPKEETAYPLMVDDLARLLRSSGADACSQPAFIREGHPGQVENKLRRMFTRARPESQELNILRGDSERRLSRRIKS